MRNVIIPLASAKQDKDSDTSTTNIVQYILVNLASTDFYKDFFSKKEEEKSGFVLQDEPSLPRCSIK
jgi:hypothetical protein